MGLPLQTSAATGAAALLALAQDDVTLRTARQAAQRLGWPASAVRQGGVAEAAALLRENAAPALLLIDVTGEADPAAALDALAEVCDPQTRVVAVGAQNDVGLYRRLLRMGVSDYLVKPVSPEALGEALQNVQRGDTLAPAVQAGPARPGRTLAVIGARGGAGATTVATSLAWSLAHEQKLRTVLIDLDLQFGSVALELDIEPGRGLREILSSPDRIDSLLIGSASRQRGERLRVLGAEEPLDADISLGGEGLAALTDCLKPESDAIVIDLPRRLDALTRAALAQADAVAVVTDLSLAGMRDSQRLLRALAVLRPGGETVLVANRVGGAPGEAPQAEFERGAGAKIDVQAPFDAKGARAAAEQGKPLLAAAPAGPAAVALRGLAERLTGGAPAARPQASWLNKLLGK